MEKMGIKVSPYIDQGAFRVFNGGSLYRSQDMMTTTTGNEPLEDILCSLLTGIVKNAGGHKGIVGMIMPELLLPPYTVNKTNHHENILLYERVINKKVSNHNINRQFAEVICFYNSSSINSFPLGYIILALNEHRYTIHKDWIHREWYPQKIINIIKNSMDENLGNGASDLILKTLKLIYKVNENEIVSYPHTFEEDLNKLLGMQQSKKILDSIRSHIIQEIIFSSEESTATNTR
jgi:hypothetical protein